MIHICLPETQPYELKIATEICTERKKEKERKISTLLLQQSRDRIMLEAYSF